MSTPKGKGQYSIAKGREAENEIVEYAHVRGYTDAERRRLSNHDTGDISGIKGVLLDVKNRRKMDLAAGMDDLAEKVLNAFRADPDNPPEVPAMIFKRPRKKAAEWYAVMTVSQLFDIIDLLDLP